MAITGTSYEELLKQNGAAQAQLMQAQALTTRQNTRYVSPYAEQIGQLLGQASAQREYVSPYAQQIDTLAGELRDARFTYDRDADPNYQAMRKQYLLEADRTASDVLAKASAPTGGRASSYAVTAASQAADYYKSQLSTQQQALFDSAYDRYYRDYTKRLQDLQVLQGRDETAYGRWQNDYTNLLQRLNALQTQDATDYSRWNTDYTNLMQLIATTGYSPTSAELAATGMTAAEAAAWRSYYERQLASGYGGGGGGSGGGYGSGYGVSGSAGSSGTGLSNADIAADARAWALANPQDDWRSNNAMDYMRYRGYDSGEAKLFASYLEQAYKDMKNKTGTASPGAAATAAGKISAAKQAAKQAASAKKTTSSSGTKKTTTPGEGGKRVMATK